jgi:iron complex outermembrane receptor protein
VPGPLARPTAQAHRQLVRVLGAAGYERETVGADGERASRLQFNAGVSQQTLRFDDRLGELGMGRPTSTDDVWRRGFARGAFGLRVLPWLEPTLVATLARDEYRPEDQFAFSAPPRPSERTSMAFALEPRLMWRMFGMPAELRPSARLEWSRADIHGERDDLREAGSDAVSVHDDIVAPTYRVAFGLQPAPALQLSTSAATGKRMPSIYELFGDRAYAEPNPRLRPESSRSVDASALVHGSAGPLRGSVELRGFALFLENMIRYERTSQFTARPDNIASAHILGLELGASGGLGRYFTLLSSLTLMQTRNELGKSLAFRPPVELVVRPELSLYPSGVDRVVVFAEMHHVAFVYLDDHSNDTSLPGRTLFDLGCALELFHERVALQARVRNLFDVQASDVLSRALPGRELLLLLSVQQQGY